MGCTPCHRPKDNESLYLELMKARSEAKNNLENYEMLRGQLGELTKVHSQALVKLQMAESRMGHFVPKEEDQPQSPKITLN